MLLSAVALALTGATAALEHEGLPQVLSMPRAPPSRASSQPVRASSQPVRVSSQFSSQSLQLHMHMLLHKLHKPLLHDRR